PPAAPPFPTRRSSDLAVSTILRHYSNQRKKVNIAQFCQHSNQTALSYVFKFSIVIIVVNRSAEDTVLCRGLGCPQILLLPIRRRSEEHTSELQSLAYL